MNQKRNIEVFSAGCAACEETIAMLNRIVCSSCEITVLDMHRPELADRAKSYGIRTVPAVVIDGKLMDCCASRGVDERVLRQSGVGVPLG